VIARAARKIRKTSDIGWRGSPAFFAGLLVVGSRPDKFSVELLTKHEWSLERAEGVLSVVTN
jgi:hypothetical protein